MKGRRRRRREYCKFTLLLVLYTLLLLLVPSVLDSGSEQDKGVRHCLRLQRSLGVWSLEAAAAREREQGTEIRFPAEKDVGRSSWSQGNLSAVGEAVTQEKQHIYVHATWRTGSSFLGELFNQHPDVFYLYEPMWHLWQALYPGDAESLQGALRDMLRSLFRCDFSVLQLYAQPGDPADRAPDLANLTTAMLFRWRTNKVICSPPLCPAAPRARAEVGLVEDKACESSCPPVPLRALEAECRKYPVVVIKDVRLLDLGVLVPLLRDPGLNLKVVQLFRDPRAVHNSRLKSRHGLLRESIQVLRTRQRGDRFHRVLLAHGLGARPGGQARGLPSAPRADFFLTSALEVICEAWLRDLLFARGAPAWLRRRYLRLRYEDLVWQPQAQLRRLLRFSGLRTVAALDAFALNMTRGSAYGADRPFHLSARDAREAVHAWRERLSQEQVHQVETACAPAMRLLAYPRSRGKSDLERELPLETKASWAT
ncbi:carbohydrate sulfotransferase 7 [Meriones unguiculatus]|uniref:carbohydrate sulfotransferase 7 n=1 Tax=Meriones unguiculatus TaxID=10047 RepID=UPI000B4FA8B0|nr:carbohydrate sulfotransferase 7 [Meriones unguiculatus]XP_060230867.1 carbohydrate sulfotransferase 7 [Meriones unguiculatus]